MTLSFPRSLSRSHDALTKKNSLFQAKLLELQSRLMHGQFQGKNTKFRSPLIKDERGSLVYRYVRICTYPEILHTLGCHCLNLCDLNL
jgi:hypothetical protein